MVGKPLLVVTYWTTGTPYEGEAARLLETVKRFSLPYAAHCGPSRGSWSANARRKAEVLWSMLDEYGDRHDVLWLDADARIRARPEALFGLQADVAVHYLGGTELLSSTLWLRDSSMTRRMLAEWLELNEELQERPFGDQENLQDVVADLEPKGLRVHRLGPKYAWIAEFSPGRHPGCGPPIIEQTQASRRHRQTVDAGA